MERKGAKQEEEEDDVDLRLSLSLSSHPLPPRSPPALPPAGPQLQVLPIRRPPVGAPFHVDFPPIIMQGAADRTSTLFQLDRGGGGVRPRRSSIRHPIKENYIPAPYPWATERKATVHSLQYLLENGIDKISGQVCCKRCENVYSMEVELHKVLDVGNYMVNNKLSMHNRSPKDWLNPKMMDCKICNLEACVRPVVDVKKKRINWLFLLITQSLGCCTLEQLKYFCKHTKSHRTGAKDRVLYHTYLCLLRQLDPAGPFYD